MIIYNGEVYNYREIRSSLAKIGYDFHTETDTEVVLAAYIHYGTDCLDLFNGMFSFAIWDKRQNMLFCGRDRLGIKPFYYAWRNSVFYFASEIKALLIPNNSNPGPNPITVYDYLSLGIMHHTENSFFSGIRQIPAACFLKVNAAGPSTKRYWSLSQDHSTCRSTPNPEVLRDILEDSVRLRLRSDVPVGILLSGGFDSSSITALAARQSEKSLQAFTLGFDDAAFDESIHAGLAASHCGADLQILKPRRIWVVG